MMGVEMFLAALMISLIRGTPSVMFIEATPAKWNVFRVICVPGSPMDCAPTAPTALPGSMRFARYLRTQRSRNVSSCAAVTPDAGLPSAGPSRVRCDRAKRTSSCLNSADMDDASEGEETRFASSGTRRGGASSDEETSAFFASRALLSRLRLDRSPVSLALGSRFTSRGPDAETNAISSSSAFCLPPATASTSDLTAFAASGAPSRAASTPILASAAVTSASPTSGCFRRGTSPLTCCARRVNSTGDASLPSISVGSRPSSPYASCTIPPVLLRTVPS
mmetsp:Transcript_560/g.2293  ORF Transcript_560/g.2293 Transcript_560/m.2293 type:complete len:279 (-) Transcript_560:3046-3882(-)